MSSEVNEAVAEIVSNRVDVDGEKIAAALAADIVERDAFDMHPSEAINDGIAAAIEEIDEATFSDAFDAVQSRVYAEVEAQAKRVALRMLRELAAQARREVAAAG
jgi:hypothetical protein